jgi:hypothetical protein
MDGAQEGKSGFLSIACAKRPAQLAGSFSHIFTGLFPRRSSGPWSIAVMQLNRIARFDKI